MQPLSLKTRLLLFLYSTRNLVGSLLAIGGLGLFFSGVIADWWFPIVAALYALGWVAVPGDRELALQVHNEATQADLLASLDDLIRQSEGRLPAEAIDRLTRIQGLVAGLAPKLFSGEVAMGSAISLVNAVTRDLPETLRNYLHLPTAFATMHGVDKGRTCKQLLLDQLDFLGEQLARIAESIYKDDAEALVVNRQFLREKFHAISFVS